MPWAQMTYQLGRCLGSLCSPWGHRSSMSGSRSSRPSGWKQAGQPNARLTIMPDTPLTNGQGFAQMEMRMEQLSKKMDAVLEELRSWRDKVQSETNSLHVFQIYWDLLDFIGAGAFISFISMILRASLYLFVPSSQPPQAVVEPKKVTHHVPLLAPQRLAPAGREEDQHEKPRTSVRLSVAPGLGIFLGYFGCRISWEFGEFTRHF